LTRRARLRYRRRPARYRRVSQVAHVLGDPPPPFCGRLLGV
jgi:hypothetical protein